VAEPLVIQVMRAYKDALLALEQAQVGRMTRAWMFLDKNLSADIRILAEEIGRARASGGELTFTQTYSQARYQTLLAQIRIEMQRYEQAATGIIRDGQGDMAQMGVRHAQGAISASYQTFGVRGTFVRLPVRAVEHMVGNTGDGGPLFGVLQQRALAPTAIEGLTDALTEATARGWNPRKAARVMQNGLTGGLQKALVIARTEQLRVYRMASDQAYRESGVVSGKRRLATRDTRTCLACLALDGEYIPIEAEMYDHVCGRCTAIPVVAGLPETKWQRGPEWFASLQADTQREMMGAKRYQAWHEGAFAFEDLATVTDDPVWGRAPQVTPLSVLSGAS
jgi:hypothetical protein